MLHYYPRHVSSINMPIFRRKNCIHTASGIVAVYKQLHSTPVESRLCSQPVYCAAVYRERRFYFLMAEHCNQFLFDKTNRRTNSQIYSGTQLYMFRASPLFIIRIYPLYIRHWHILCSFEDRKRYTSWERSALNRYDTICCVNTIFPPEDGHVNAWNMSRIIV